MGICENQRPNKANRGQVLVLFAVALFALFGFAAIAIDVGFWYHTRNQLQGAADAAALAGASMLTCEKDTGSVYLNQNSARQEAIRFANENTAAQKPVVLASNSSFNTYSSNNDITVGNWDGTAYTRADGTKGFRINAVQVRARRTNEKSRFGASPGGAVTTFFAKTVGLTEVNVKVEAIAKGCFIKNFTPISINEYWMGQQPISGGGTCNDTTYSVPAGLGKREPYEFNHVYPNSFVRPPCTERGEGSSGSCKTPSNGNVFNNYTFPSFKTKDCNGNNITVTENGPLLDHDCSGDECKGRPDDGGDPATTKAGRVFAVVGGTAYNNNNSNMFSLLDLDRRTSSSDPAVTSWYDNTANFMNNPPLSSASSNPDKSIAAGYIKEGTYPYELPISVFEVYQPGYVGVTFYPSVWPYASLSYFNGQGLAGQMVKDNFYDNGKYSTEKQYAPGETIIVTVYDGILNGGGSQSRTTIVGFSRVTICGYGDKLQNANVYPFTCQSPTGNPSPYIKDNPQNTMYGYVASTTDALTQNVFDFYELGFKTVLVK